MSKCRVRTRAQNSPLEVETEDDGDTSTIKGTYIRTGNEPIKSLDTRMQKIGAGTGDCCRWAKAGIVAIIIVIGRAGDMGWRSSSLRHRAKLELWLSSLGKAGVLFTLP